MSGRLKSEVWKHFIKDPKYPFFAKCKICNKQYKCSGNTTNLKDHLKRFHPFVSRFNEHEDEGVCDDPDPITPNPVPGTSTGTISCTSTPTQTPGISAVKKSKEVRPSKGIKHGIKDYIERTKKYDDNSLRKKQLDDGLVEMMVEDLEPFNIVNRKGFRSFVSMLDPKYELPSKSHLKDVLLPKTYNETKQKLKSMLNAVQYVAITSDIWTSPSNEGYLTVTCHFIYNRKLRSAVLKTMTMTGSHTGEAIANDLLSTFIEWNIRGKVVCLVTDNGANMILAAKILNVQHLPCFAHTLNLVVSDALQANKDIVNTLKKVKAIVTHFRSSTLAADKLRETQIAMGKKVLKLINETPTRWNSTLFMVRRIIEVKDCLAIAMSSLPNSPPPLTAEDILLLQDMGEALAPFEVATEDISGEEYVTVSLINPLVAGLYQHLMEANQNVKTNTGLQLVFDLQAKIIERLFPYENKDITSLGTLIDPRYKKLGFRKIEIANNAAKKLTSAVTLELRQINETSTSSTATSSSTCSDATVPVPNTSTGGNPSVPTSNPQPSSKKKRIDLLNFVSNAAKKQINTPAQSDAIILIRQYFELKVIDRKKDPIVYWADANEEYLPLAQLSKKFLCVPGSSVPSERIFSKAGLIMTEKRNRLKSKNVDRLIFLKNNAWIVKDKFV